MKELSIEEKAKAYDEALKVAEKYHNGTLKDVMETIFPELAKSENERIRKELLNAFKEATDSLYMVLTPQRRKSFISWLEKQGEQKPTDSKIIDIDELVIELEETIGTSPHSRETIKDFFQKAIQKYMKCLQIANGEIGRLMDENYYLKEQITAERSEEDEWCLKQINFLIRNSYSVDDKVERLSNWLKSLKDRVQPQILTVTDEELIKARNEAYNDALDKLEYHSDTPTFNDGWSAAIWYLKKRNVQPQNRWKPSKEQIMGIDCAIKTLRHQLNVGDKRLNSLYDDLKKLMEE